MLSPLVAIVTATPTVIAVEVAFEFSIWVLSLSETNGIGVVIKAPPVRFVYVPFVGLLMGSSMLAGTAGLGVGGGLNFFTSSRPVKISIFGAAYVVGGSAGTVCLWVKWSELLSCAYKRDQRYTYTLQTCHYRHHRYTCTLHRYTCTHRYTFTVYSFKHQPLDIENTFTTRSTSKIQWMYNVWMSTL